MPTNFHRRIIGSSSGRGFSGAAAALSSKIDSVAGHYSNRYYSDMRTLRLDPYVVETLMGDLVGHDHSPSSFLVYLMLWSRTGMRRGAKARVSHRQLAEDTGLSKSAVQGAVRNLARRRLIAVSRSSATAVPEYTVLRPWIRGR